MLKAGRRLPNLRSRVSANPSWGRANLDQRARSIVPVVFLRVLLRFSLECRLRSSIQRLVVLLRSVRAPATMFPNLRLYLASSGGDSMDPVSTGSRKVPSTCISFTQLVCFRQVVAEEYFWDRPLIEFCMAPTSLLADGL